MKPTLIPKSKSDRRAAGVALFFAVITATTFTWGPLWLRILGGFTTLIWIFNAYALPEPVASDPSSDEYSRTINSITQIGDQLSDLSRFLQTERARVADTEATIRKLNDEKTKLEPLVQTQRETVDAILAAHAERTRMRAWKERLIGFGFGLAASLLASIVYGYFKR